MAKFEVEMTINRLELRIKGEREDIPQINENLGQQITGLFKPTSNIVSGQLPAKQVEAKVLDPNANGNAGGTAGNRGKGGRRPRKPGSLEGKATTALSWSHDPSKWGTARQAWTAYQKITWLLYVAHEAASATEMSGPQIAETFNTHFRQAGLLRKQNMPRDLGTLKQRSPSIVSDHADKTPITWFLTEEGMKDGAKLVQEACGLFQQGDGPQQKD